MRRYLFQIVFAEHHDCLWMVTNEATNFDVVTLTNDDGQVAFVHEHGQRLMGFVNERAGGVDHFMATIAPCHAIGIG